MTRIDLPYVHKFTDRHGHVRCYFRRPGYKRIALPGKPGSPEFLGAYEAAMAGETAPKLPIGADRTKAGTLDALAVRYMSSLGFRQLSDATRATYADRIERLRRKHGSKPVALMQRQNVRHVIETVTDKPTMANGLLKTLRTLMRFAVEEGWRRDDPTAGVKPWPVHSEGWHAWTEAEIARYEARWPIGTRERLMLTLALYTGQRRTDLVQMGRQHIQDGRIRVRQHKTGTVLQIPLLPALKVALDALPPGQLTFLITAGGTPFTPNGFGNAFREAARAAGLTDCPLHGLRKAIATRLAQAGCTTHEIAAITGHRTLREVEIYTRAVNQGALADAAMIRLSRIANTEGENKA